jgi:alpha,alpha-trehalose-phosphate synthase [UDP-forming]
MSTETDREEIKLRPGTPPLQDWYVLPGRFLVVSNRLPYQISSTNGELEFTRGLGGLVTALDPILWLAGGTWIGWTGSYDSLPDSVSLGEASGSTSEYRLRLVHLTPQEVETYYLGYSNKSLWPLFHCFQELSEFSRQHWSTYREVNQKFADAVIEEYREGNLIWVHDYHLLLVPAMIRRALPKARIGFFLHIPFPPSELFLVEPHAEELLEGMLGADLVGFHVDRYARNFLAAVEAAIGRRCKSEEKSILLEARKVRVDSFAISIPFERFETLAHQPETARQVAEIRDYYHADVLALGVDRLDYTKGILERLRAIEIMLEIHPELQGRFTFVQISAPSRTKVHAYREMRKQIEQMVGHINGRFAARGCIPVDYRYEGYSQEELVAYYRASDLALVTPLRDGMNLVAKEYVASQVDDAGALVLSHFAGAHEELPDAIMVNPYDPEGMATSIHQAIEMSSEERQERMRRMRDTVRKNDVYTWVERFLRALA